MPSVRMLSMISRSRWVPTNRTSWPLSARGKARAVAITPDPKTLTVVTVPRSPDVFRYAHLRHRVLRRSDDPLVGRKAGTLPQGALLSGDRAEGEAPHQVAPHGQADDNHRQRDDRSYRRKLAPVHARLRDKLRGRYRERLATRTGEGHSEGVVVPREDQAEDRRGDYPRGGQRQRHAPEGLEPGCTVHHRRLLHTLRQVGEEGVHDPNREGQIEAQVGDDESPYGVDQVQEGKADEQRQDHRCDGGHPRRDDPERQMAFALEVDAGEPV